MATSNSTDYTQTRNEIIADALNLLGVYTTGDTISSNDYTFCSNILNKMIKGWESRGLHLWTEEEGVIFLTPSVNDYFLTTSNGSSTGANIVLTTLASTATAGTSITVNSVLGMSVSDRIAVKVDSDTYTITTISAIDTSSKVITLVGSLSGTATAGNVVMVYTNLLDRPLNIMSARFLNSSGAERPIQLVGRAEFENMNNKFNTGKVNLAYYSPKISTANFKVWPAPDSDEDCIRISYLRRIQDFDSSSDNADIPQEWLEAITYNLAVRIASAFGIDANKRDPSIPFIAQQSLMDLEIWDVEPSSTRVVPNFRSDD